MVVAVVAVRMMKVAAHEIVHVISVRNGLVSTSGAVLVICAVGGARVARRAVRRIRRAHSHSVFVHVVGMGVMEVAVVQVVGVVFVTDGQMAAAFPVNV